MTALFDGVIGQERAVAQLRAAARSPVHAYLLVGPAGSGKRLAARSFAAALLCARGGCGDCRDCTLACAELHPDLVVVEPEGNFILAKQADEIIRQASLSPAEGARKVMLLAEFQRVHPQVGPKLLKTVEEPPASTFFVILAEDVPPELVTIASRAVRIDFGPVPEPHLVDALVAEGVDRATAETAAHASGGRADRARLLASDPGFAGRLETWQSVPARLDGTGAAAATLAAELRDLLADASTAPLEARHAAELDALQERADRYGERGAGRRDLDDRHKREVRRLRTDELRFGLAVLERAYRDVIATAPPAVARAALDAVAAIHEAAHELSERNPNEALLLQALLMRLSACEEARAGMPYSPTAPG